MDGSGATSNSRARRLVILAVGLFAAAMLVRSCVRGHQQWLLAMEDYAKSNLLYKLREVVTDTYRSSGICPASIDELLKDGTIWEDENKSIRYSNGGSVGSPRSLREVTLVIPNSIDNLELVDGVLREKPTGKEVWIFEVPWNGYYVSCEQRRAAVDWYNVACEISSKQQAQP